MSAEAKIVLVIILAVAAMAAAVTAARRGTPGAVTANDPLGPFGSVRTFWATTVDGREIPCVVALSGRGVGLSCDWSRPRVAR